MARTYCYTYFRIVGDFDPDAVTALLGIRPDRTRKKGDLRRNGTKYAESAWECGRCADYSGDVDCQMRRTIAPLTAKIEQLREIRRTCGVSMFLEVVPTVAPDEPTPCLAPSLAVMQFCCDTGTELDIDLYCV